MKKLYTIMTIVACTVATAFAQTPGTQVNFTKSTKGTGASEAAVTPGVGEINNNANVKIYSYGNTVFVNTTLSYSNSSVEIYNLLGELVINSRMSSSNATFAIDHNASSYYIVKVTLDNNSYTKRVYIR